MVTCQPSTADPRPLVTRQIIQRRPEVVLKARLITADWKAPRALLSLNLIYIKYDSQYWNRTSPGLGNDNPNRTNGRSQSAAMV